jgi:hypothetical protein
MQMRKHTGREGRSYASLDSEHVLWCYQSLMLLPGRHRSGNKNCLTTWPIPVGGSHLTTWKADWIFTRRRSMPIGRNGGIGKLCLRRGMATRGAGPAWRQARADELLLASRRLKSMPRSAPQAVSRAPPGQNWKAHNPLLPSVCQPLAKSRSPVDRDGSF